MNTANHPDRGVATRVLRALLEAARGGRLYLRGSDLIAVAGETRLERMDPCGVDAGFTVTAANVVAGLGSGAVHLVDPEPVARHLGRSRTAALRWDGRGLTVNGQRVNTIEADTAFGDLRLDLDRPVRSARFDPERLAAVAAAAGTDSIRYALNGVNFDFAAHCLVASDGARLHASNGDTLSCSGTGPVSVIVPTTAARQMADARMGYMRTDGNVVIGLGEGLTLRTYAVDGEFPDYQRLLRPGAALVPVRLAPTALEALRIADSMGRRSKLTQAGIEIPARPGTPTLQRTGVTRRVAVPPVLAGGVGAASVYLSPGELRDALLAAGNDAEVLVAAEGSPDTELHGDRLWATAPVHVVSPTRPHFRAVVQPLPL
ncbi:MAG TPA: hypothetical protein PKV98_13285 [Burkholderiaceae bacterium]|nr:hypothetical protein [Burkholderiaceae bacterium]